MAKLIKVCSDISDKGCPNNVYKGYEKSGRIKSNVEVGKCFHIDNLVTTKVTEIIEKTPSFTKFKTSNSTYIVKYEARERSRPEVQLPLTFRRDFRSVDKQAAISAEGILFLVGDIVRHVGDIDGEPCAIKKFSVNNKNNGCNST